MPDEQPMDSFAETTAADLARQCLASFDRCLVGSSTGPSHRLPSSDGGARGEGSRAGERAIVEPKRNERLGNQLASFNLWVDGVGVFALGDDSLDSRFRQRPGGLFIVKGILAMLHQFLEESAELAEQGLRINEGLQKVGSLLDSLAVLAVAIQQTGKRWPGIPQVDIKFDPKEHQELEAHLEFIARLKPPTREREAKCLRESRVPPPKLRMQRCLIEANLRRRNRFIQAQRRSAGLEEGGEGCDSRAFVSLPPAELTLEIISGFVDATLPNAPEPVPPACLLPVQNASPTVSRTPASIPESLRHYLGPGGSNLTAASTQITFIGAAARYPRPKIPDTKHGVFRCPYCCQLLPVQDVRSNSDWRKHLAQDVRPYTCLANNCPNPHIYYSTRSALEHHIQDDHAPTCHCTLCDDDDDAEDPKDVPIFQTMTGIMEHFHQHHAEFISDDILPTLLSWSARHGMGIDACPLCECLGPRDSPDLVDHVLQHIHDFALRSLPWPAQAPPDLDGEVGTFNPGAPKADQTIQWLILSLPHADCADAALQFFTTWV